MNKERRKRINEALKALESLRDDIEDIKDEEEETLVNYPENLTGSERYEAAEEALSCLGDAFDNIETAIDSLKSAMAR